MLIKWTALVDNKIHALQKKVELYFITELVYPRLSSSLLGHNWTECESFEDFLLNVCIWLKVTSLTRGPTQTQPCFLQL